MKTIEKLKFKIGDMIMCNGHYPLVVYNNTPKKVTSVRVVTKEDLENGFKVSIGMRALINKKGSAIVIRHSGMSKHNSALSQRFFSKVKTN